MKTPNAESRSSTTGSTDERTVMPDSHSNPKKVLYFYFIFFALEIYISDSTQRKRSFKISVWEKKPKHNLQLPTTDLF